MPKSKHIMERRKKAISKVNSLFEDQQNVFCIHYSCERFYNRTDGSSPRVTSIALCNLDSKRVISFSIHKIAEIEKIALENIQEEYNSLELKMLNEFTEFMKRNEKGKFLHWNMRDANFGFPALDHRHRVLGGSGITIYDNNLYDLSKLLKDIYGENYIAHPRLIELVKLNGISDKDLLAGEKEAEAFENKEFIKLHQSTLRKSYVLNQIAVLVHEEQLRTNSKWREKYGISIASFVEIVTDHWIFKLLGAIAIIITILSLLQFI